MAEADRKKIVEHETLVQYATPILMVKQLETTRGAEGDVKRQTSGGAELDITQKIYDTLNKILPPRCWEEDGQMWQQIVSTVPSTIQDVIDLQERLDMRLQLSHARETGICPLRRELYTQCLDEIIRQLTINTAEQGLLLVRLRDEINMTLREYETMYCSSVAYGVRKALQVYEEKEMLRARVTELEADKEVLDARIHQLRLAFGQSEERNNEIRVAEEKKFSEEANVLKKSNFQLKNQLEAITAIKK